MKFTTFRDWVVMREDMNAPTPAPQATNPLAIQKGNKKIGDVAAKLTQQLKLIPGKVDDRQLQAVMGHPEVKALGPDAGKVITALQGGVS
jgi:hypothetical protein